MAPTPLPDITDITSTKRRRGINADPGGQKSSKQARMGPGRP